MTSLTPRNREILKWIQNFVSDENYFPTYREIQDGFKFKSISPVQHHIKTLIKAGLIEGNPKKARTLKLSEEQPDGIPIEGTIAAGSFVDFFPKDTQREFIPSDLFSPQSQGMKRFALRVKGDSMINAHILDNDIVILDQPENPKELKDMTIVAARIKGEDQTTLKRWQRKGKQVELIPENPKYETMKYPIKEVLIEGVYVGVIRDMI
ncbi:transcriptional repressor LexA [Leptothoe kymatousa]|uniref:Repressor LexA n=1 Tax=Leptothoe kymatousa TAU-MAC 1615 TaxID=2364775 RepID=A0ABS5Y7K7_9CYAN|nr:transcriptional repressor LexA [Leptothoe kymatousa]MBT9313790.1 repressor LexA [Leptothoe kymatousa TAU-MAC 1615]